MSLSWSHKPPGSNGTSDRDPYHILNDHVRPIKTKNQNGQLQGSIIIIGRDMGLAITLEYTIGRVVGIENPHDGNGPNQAPEQGHPERRNPYQ
jgi:hypothetical protein